MHFEENESQGKKSSVNTTQLKKEFSKKIRKVNENYGFKNKEEVQYSKVPFFLFSIPEFKFCEVLNIFQLNSKDQLSVFFRSKGKFFVAFFVFQMSQIDSQNKEKVFGNLINCFQIEESEDSGEIQNVTDFIEIKGQSNDLKSQFIALEDRQGKRLFKIYEISKEDLIPEGDYTFKKEIDEDMKEKEWKKIQGKKFHEDNSANNYITIGKFDRKKKIKTKSPICQFDENEVLIGDGSNLKSLNLKTMQLNTINIEHEEQQKKTEGNDYYFYNRSTSGINAIHVVENYLVLVKSYVIEVFWKKKDSDKFLYLQRVQGAIGRNVIDSCLCKEYIALTNSYSYDIGGAQKVNIQSLETRNSGFNLYIHEPNRHIFVSPSYLIASGSRNVKIFDMESTNCLYTKSLKNGECDKLIFCKGDFLVCSNNFKTFLLCDAFVKEFTLDDYGNRKDFVYEYTDEEGDLEIDFYSGDMCSYSIRIWKYLIQDSKNFKISKETKSIKLDTSYYKSIIDETKLLKVLFGIEDLEKDSDKDYFEIFRDLGCRLKNNSRHFFISTNLLSTTSEKGELCNLKIITNDKKEFMIHKELFLLKLNLFHRMVSFNGIEKEMILEDGEIELNDLNSEMFNLLKQFIYSKEINRKELNKFKPLLELFIYSEKYQEIELKTYLNKVIPYNMKMELVYNRKRFESNLLQFGYLIDYNNPLFNKICTKIEAKIFTYQEIIEKSKQQFSHNN